MFASLGRALVRPAVALLSPFRLVWKFFIAVVLLAVPLAIVVNDYVGQQGSQISFTTSEQAGVTYLGPANQLLGQVLLARHDVLAGQAVPASLTPAVAAVDAVDGQVGTQLGLRGDWQAARSAISSAQAASSTSASQTFQNWGAAATEVQNLIGRIADTSNLSVDPRLDSHYLQDALTVQLPAYLVQLGRSSDIGSFDAKAATDQAMAKGAANQSLQSALADLGKLANATSDTSLVGQLSPLQQGLSGSGKADLAEAVRNSANLESAATPGLGHLLAVRVSDLQGGQLRNELLAIVLGVIAVWLVIAVLVQAGDATTKLVATMERVADGDVTAQTDVVGQDEFGQVARHLNAALARIRQSLQVISEKTTSVLASSRDLASISTDMSGTAETVSDKAAAVSAASEQVNTNVTVVAAAIEEMVASVKEIASNASKASEVATRASGIASLAGENIARLEASSVEISNVVSLITSIAEQTNLLALNATIEAARAGEMGKGFAVVANEVKDLAAKTTKATEDISHRIEAIQVNTQSATESVTQIREIVEEINDIQGSIASSVEEQAAAVSEVGRSVAEAATSTGTIVENITGVAVSARGNQEMAEKNQESVEGVSAVSNELQVLIGSLLGQFHFENGQFSGEPSHF